MRDYNTITAGLLKNAPHGIDCYVSNVSYVDAMQDIHCTGDAVKRIFPCSNGDWWNTINHETKHHRIGNAHLLGVDLMPRRIRKP